MSILHDSHLHTSFSGDSKTPMQEIIQTALSKGLKGLCITEHLDFDYPICEECPKDMFVLNIPAYYKHYSDMYSLYQDKLELCFGVELGLQPHLIQKHQQILNEYPFDFVIGSVHTCHAKDPYFPAFYKEREEEECYREYFSCILENLNTFDNFDTFGHLDYVVRYGPNKDAFYSYERYQDLLDPILIKLVSMGKALECNTGAINYGLKSLNPSKEILKKYKKLGGEHITIGSDAHKPSALGNGFDMTKDYLIECGFTHYTTFKNRIPYMHKL